MNIHNIHIYEHYMNIIFIYMNVIFIYMNIMFICVSVLDFISFISTLLTPMETSLSSLSAPRTLRLVLSEIGINITKVKVCLFVIIIIIVWDRAKRLNVTRFTKGT